MSQQRENPVHQDANDEQMVTAYPYIELAAQVGRSRMTRNQFVLADDSESLLRWRQQYPGCPVYTSVCQFAEPSRNSRYVCPFFIDINEPNSMFTARMEALRACYLLEERLGIGPESIDIFFDAPHRFQLVVPHEVFQAAGTNELMATWRALAAEIASRAVPHLDLSVYSTSHLVRLPDVLDPTTRKCRFALDAESLIHLEDWVIMEIAVREKGGYVPRRAARRSPIPRAMEWFRAAAAQRARAPRPIPQAALRGKGGWRTPPCVRKLEQVTLPGGCRHDAYVGLASFYLSIGMAPQEAVERLRVVDARNPIPDPDFINGVVSDAQTDPTFACCVNVALASFCSPTRCHLAPIATPTMNESVSNTEPNRVVSGEPRDIKPNHVFQCAGTSGSAGETATSDQTPHQEEGIPATVAQLHFHDLLWSILSIERALSDYTTSRRLLHEALLDTPIVGEILADIGSDVELCSPIPSLAELQLVRRDLAVILAIREKELQSLGILPYHQSRPAEDPDMPVSFASLLLEERSWLGGEKMDLLAEAAPKR